jgi:hypothetical protein
MSRPLAAENVQPWHCGSQFADWISVNCERCVKYEPEGAPAACEIDHGIMQAMLDGDMPRDLAERCGWVEDENPYVWDCPERVLSPKAEAE